MNDSTLPIISAEGISKVFRLYRRQRDRIKEILTIFGKKNYYTPFYALRDISLEIYKGETVGIIGRNGSGKSTLLQIICGILQPTEGDIKVKGRISALLELGAGFNPEFSGRENVFLNGSILGLSRSEVEACFDDIATFADIGEFIDQPVKSYSSGMYVRLAFAVAINVNPSILIVDEALSVGDTQFQAKCFAKFREFQEKGVTILFVTHSMDLITRYCSKAFLLEKGRLVKSGAAKEVVDEYNRMVVNCFADQDDVENEEPLKLVASHMRKSEQTYQLNPNENRYGNGRAEIIEVGVDSLSERGSHTFTHGERYRFWFKTMFHETVFNPITAYTIKDVKGFDLCGTNTLFKKKEIGTVHKGDIILTEFEQRMMLNPGGYLLSFGCAGFEEGEYVVYDRRYDVITFEVVSAKSSVGIFDLDSEVTISQLT
ncbi:ABC transporter ATP-binding protein [Desulfogranum marinum]|uniref:ABC transporter ATP-binding protein n=1 Tax=Desulfogranum marinum TaxID=453220 RepID=UPI0029C808E1|nr:ABC transporter ATP-binding protein [Desulfogranum marinum]